MKVPNLSPLKLFASAWPRPALAPAGIGGNMMFASGGDDDGYDYPDSGEEQPPARSRQVTGNDSGRGRGDSAGRQRSIQFQPEERYWTDYLRIALPVIGLLLMVGLFWYWVQMLIDDPSPSDEPASTTTAQGLPEIATSPSTPAPTSVPAVNPDQPPAAGATQAPAQKTPESGEQAAETPAEQGGSDDPMFAAGDSARINDDGVNLRSQPTTQGEGEIIATLDTDTVVTIGSGPEDSDELIWWEIVVEDTGESGWVAQQYLEPTE